MCGTADTTTRALGKARASSFRGYGATRPLRPAPGRETVRPGSAAPASVAAPSAAGRCVVGLDREGCRTRDRAARAQRSQRATAASSRAVGTCTQHGPGPGRPGRYAVARIGIPPDLAGFGPGCSGVSHRRPDVRGEPAHRGPLAVTARAQPSRPGWSPGGGANPPDEGGGPGLVRRSASTSARVGARAVLGAGRHRSSQSTTGRARPRARTSRPGCRRHAHLAARAPPAIAGTRPRGPSPAWTGRHIGPPEHPGQGGVDQVQVVPRIRIDDQRPPPPRLRPRRGARDLLRPCPARQAVQTGTRCPARLTSAAGKPPRPGTAPTAPHGAA